jgi:hypothetical protein
MIRAFDCRSHEFIEKLLALGRGRGIRLRERA